MKKKLTYISLFSSAGVGCFGFKQNDFECIATNELITRRIEVQRFNNKCRYDRAYINGDITKSQTQKQLLDEIKYWEKHHQLDSVDVVVATPPCQGMSVANHKKKNDEIIRNSLVVESIHLVDLIRPKFFVFENVAAFLKTACTDRDGQVKSINDAIERNLGKDYVIYGKVINFKNYGSNSSRTRTLVIGVHKKYANDISPIELFPPTAPVKTLREVIGDMKSMNDFDLIDESDFYHFFRNYPERMRAWVENLEEGKSAFDNLEDHRIPHQIKDGKLVFNKRKNGDKYTRQIWDKVGPCIHTRNDQFASQNTIHPSDDRVFSIRELMELMTIPRDFKWVNQTLEILNEMPHKEKRSLLKKEEIKIRQSIGEAVPTTIFSAIAKEIKSFLSLKVLNKNEIANLIKDKDLVDLDHLKSYLKKEKNRVSLTSLSKVAELANALRSEHSAFYTDKKLVNKILSEAPSFQKDQIRILEPSVGVGNFLPLIAKRYQDIKKVIIDVVDIDKKSLEVLKILVDDMNLSKNITINFIHDDFLLHSFDHSYDLIIGNPPFTKMGKSKLLETYRQMAVNSKSKNLFSFFLEKATKIATYVIMITPKSLLNTPEFIETRSYLKPLKIDRLIDFGEKGFDDVKVETIAIFINPLKKAMNVVVESITEHKKITQKQKYITDPQFPYWIIYRDNHFDEVCQKLNFDIFTCFRDRQITNKILKDQGDIRVIRSRNISDDGNHIMTIDGYDKYLDKSSLEGLSVAKFIDRTDVYLTPNMTYYPRVATKSKGNIVNGSVAVLILKDGQEPLSDLERAYFSSKDYRSFYKVARNYQTRSLNIDSSSVYFFGRYLGGDNE